MDKILLTSEDLDPLFEWRDKHLDLVLRCPCPLKAIEIHVATKEADGSPFYLRCIREKLNRLRLYIGAEGEPASGYFLLERLPDGKWLQLKNTIPGKETEYNPNKKGFGDSMVAVYGTIMAIMAYSSDIETPEPDNEPQNKSKTQKNIKKSAKKKKRSEITYILRRNGKNFSVGHKGSHASPKGIFTVRGHWRRYKNGNKIWVSEYKKGTGKKKSKTYKIGGDVNER